MTLVIATLGSLVQRRLRCDADDIICRRLREGHVERMLLPGSKHSDKCLCGCRRLTNRTLDCLKTLTDTSMPPCVEVLGLQSYADSSLWHVNISVEASAEDAHGLQRDSDLLWPVHARCETRLLCEALTPTSVPLAPHGQGPQVRLDAGAERHSRVCWSSVAHLTKFRLRRNVMGHKVNGVALRSLSEVS
jgi:hypothetical protein